MQRATQLYADDLAVGFAFRGEAKLLSLEHFSQFSALTGDKHPIHYDPTFATKTTFGRPVAHGLLLTAMTAFGATPFSEAIEDAMIALVEQQMRFLRPAFVGDVVTPEFKVASNKPSARGRVAPCGAWAAGRARAAGIPGLACSAGGCVAFGIPLIVLMLGAALVWAFSGFAATLNRTVDHYVEHSTISSLILAAAVMVSGATLFQWAARLKGAFGWQAINER